ncbi:helix-turn-helix domain-containing protein [Cohnella sp. GCM10012308]|uniref:helix-turn-helix domain-containing protein n=1 Tax=Cohnella sp. GCM10012308 TaxID=3317329 RepID=UPI0036069DAB
MEITPEHLYRLKHAASVVSPFGPMAFAARASGRLTLLVPTKGEGAVVIDGINYRLGQIEALVLPAGVSWRLERSEENRALACAVLEFDSYAELGDGRLVLRAPATGVSRIALPPAAASLAQAAIEGWSGDALGRMEANVRFQACILAVLRASAEAEAGAPGSLVASVSPGREREEASLQTDGREAIRAAIAYIKANLARPLTREALARQAGMSVAHFSRLFKQETGRAPMEYLNDARIGQAAELLQRPGRTIRETAHEVGFQDEFYFSRKFKSVKGVSPVGFAKSLRRSTARIASVAYPYTDHLLALGIRPHAALVPYALPPAPEWEGVIGVGRLQPDLDRLVGAQPELIIGFQSEDYEEPDKAAFFSRIAQTCTVGFGGEWREHLMTIARAVGRMEEAERWLAKYEALASGARRSLRDRIGEETVAVAQLEDGKFRLFGDRNLGTVLYRDLGLTKPKELANVSHSALLSPERLAACDIDHLLLFSSDDARVRATLLRAPGTRSALAALKAARTDRVYDLGGSQAYACYSSLSHERFLRRMAVGLMSRSSMR